MLGQNF